MKRLASHDLSILGKRERALAQQQVAPGEHVRFCLVGHKGHALIALDRRVVLIKGGSGGRAASFAFSEIGAIRVHTGKTKGSIEIQTSVLGATKAHDFWATNDATDRFKLPNSMPIVTSDLPAYAHRLAELHSLVSDAKQHVTSVAAEHERAWDDLAGQLQGLGCCLHGDGLRCDAEFADANRAALTA